MKMEYRFPIRRWMFINMPRKAEATMKIAKLMTIAMLGLPALLFGTETIAEEAAPASDWKMSAELGYVMTSGNSETSTTNAKFDATHEKEVWRNNVHAEALGASTTDKTTNVTTTSAERYQLSGKSDYKFSEFNYAFGLANYDKDRFSGYEYQTTVAVGYGRRLLQKDDMTLDLEVGPGIRIIKLDNAADSDSEGILRAAAKYLWKLSETSSFTEDLSVDSGKDLTVSKSVTALTAKVNTSLAMKLTVTVKHNSDVPAGNEKTDTETALNLVYSF